MNKPISKFKETELGPIPEGWEVLPIHELARWVNGLSFKNIIFSPSGKPVVKINELKYGITGQTQFTEETFDEDYLLKKGDLLFSWSGSPDTSIDAFWYNLPDGWLNQHIFKVNPKEGVLADYLYYIFKTYKQRFIEIARDKQTTGLGHVTLADLKRFHVALPPLPEQKRIAEILSFLDDKIELNRQINANLEKTAAALFKKWFVDAGDEPVRRSLGEGGLPKGWRTQKIGDVVAVKGGSTPSTNKSEYWQDGSIAWATPRDLANLKSLALLDTEKKITELGLAEISSGLLPAGTILLSSRAPIGYVAVANIPVAVNQGFIAICADSTMHAYLLFWVKNNISLIESRANGSTFLEINKANFRDIDIVVPDSVTLEKFEKAVGPMVEAIIHNELEIKNLAQIRDSLLPRLMSGKMRV